MDQEDRVISVWGLREGEEGGEGEEGLSVRGVYMWGRGRRGGEKRRLEYLDAGETATDARGSKSDANP